MRPLFTCFFIAAVDGLFGQRAGQFNQFQ